MLIKTVQILITLFLLLFHSAFSFATQKNLPEPCQQLFNMAEKFITEAKRQPGTHPQFHRIEEKFRHTKKQITQMKLITQIKVCTKGLAKLNSKTKADESDN